MRSSALEHDHSPAAIRERLSADPKPSYLRDAVFGAIDGTVTTFSIVAGVSGAALSGRIVLVLGLANLLADGFSMAIGAASSTRSEQRNIKRLRAMEHRHIEQDPEGERAEVCHLLQRLGFSGDALRSATEVITADRERWVEFMLREEHGIARATRSPWRSGLMTFAGFLSAGALPLAPFALGASSGFFVSAVATGFAFCIIGAATARLTDENMIWGAMRILTVGSIAAALAYGVGRALEPFL
ncbi:MAG: VIT1/CCC1 transporter family protein [Myxococcota bacterium]